MALDGQVFVLGLVQIKTCVDRFFAPIGEYLKGDLNVLPAGGKRGCGGGRWCNAGQYGLSVADRKLQVAAQEVVANNGHLPFVCVSKKTAPPGLERTARTTNNYNKQLQQKVSVKLRW